jgi:hypothetical protein
MIASCPSKPFVVLAAIAVLSCVVSPIDAHASTWTRIRDGITAPVRLVGHPGRVVTLIGRLDQKSGFEGLRRNLGLTKEFTRRVLPVIVCGGAGALLAGPLGAAIGGAVSFAKMKNRKVQYPVDGTTDLNGEATRYFAQMPEDELLGVYRRSCSSRPCGRTVHRWIRTIRSGPRSLTCRAPSCASTRGLRRTNSGAASPSSSRRAASEVGQ